MFQMTGVGFRRHQMISTRAHGLLRGYKVALVVVRKRRTWKRDFTTSKVKWQEEYDKSGYGPGFEDLDPDAPLEPSSLVKPFLFAMGFTAGVTLIAKSFEARRLHKEEALAKRKRHQADDDNLNFYKFKRLSEEDRKSKAFWPIFVANVMVFMAWRLRPLQPTMVKYFLANPAASSNCWPMVLSAFSHIAGIHLLTNMYVLYSFTQEAVTFMGPEQFFAFYLSSAVISTFTSYAARVAFNRPGFSLGASGAVMGVLGYVCTIDPDALLGFILVPVLTLKASNVLAGLIAGDILGLFQKGSMFDHGAHLGGSFFGIFWATLGSKMVWHSDHMYDVGHKKKK